MAPPLIKDEDQSGGNGATSITSFIYLSVLFGMALLAMLNTTYASSSVSHSINFRRTVFNINSNDYYYHLNCIACLYRLSLNHDIVYYYQELPPFFANNTSYSEIIAHYSTKPSHTVTVVMCILLLEIVVVPNIEVNNIISDKRCPGLNLKCMR